jgi:predicted outer membrane protein
MLNSVEGEGMRYSLTGLLACAAFSISACASSGRYNSNAASGTVDLPTFRDAALSTRERDMLRGMSDADILGHFITVDSLEVATADSALRLSKSDAVLDLAKLMKASHSSAVRDDRDLAKQQGIRPIMVFGGFAATHVAASLDSVGIASEVTLDRHYVISQIELHQHVLAEMEILRNVAQNAAVRDHITAMMPVMRDHLARAEALAEKKGFVKKPA